MAVARAETGADAETAAEEAVPRLEVVCLSPQPWDVDLPTNRQQIMSRVGRRGHSVLFVDTSGFVGRDLRALVAGGARRALLRKLVRTERVADGVRVMRAPNVLPWGHRLRLAVRVNAWLTARAVRRRAGREGTRVLWLYDPCYADVIGAAGEAVAAYDCVDDYAEQSGDDVRKRALVAEYDRLAASRADVVFATATPLRDRHVLVNENTHLVRNVGDFDHFASASPEPGLEAAARPVIGFAGNFLPGKVDLGLLEELAERRPAWSFVLAGPAGGETAARLAQLGERPNVSVVGARSYAEVPGVVAAFDVGLIPYRTNAYTASCFPLKVFEYLAAGKPVVATGLPELAGLEPAVVLADGADGVLAAIERAADAQSPAEVEERRRLAAANTWDTRTDRLLELVARAL